MNFFYFAPEEEVIDNVKWLYVDEFIEVYPSFINIKDFHYPAYNKRIALKDVTEYSIMKEKNPITFKAWGLSIDFTWWSCDPSRWISNHPNVVLKVQNEYIKKGFSINEKGAEILKKALDDAK